MVFAAPQSTWATMSALLRFVAEDVADKSARARQAASSTCRTHTFKTKAAMLHTLPPLAYGSGSYISRSLQLRSAQ